MSARAIFLFSSCAAVLVSTAVLANDFPSRDDLADSSLERDLLTAANPGPHDSDLLLLLSLFDEDPSVDELRRFEPGLPEKLEAIAQDEDVLFLPRSRAVFALGALGGEAAYSVVARLALADHAQARVRMAALWAIGHRFASVDGREEVLARALREQDHGLRLHAVQSLAKLGTPKAWALIDAHRAVERHVAVRAILRELHDAEVGSNGRMRPEGIDRVALPARPGPGVPAPVRGEGNTVHEVIR